MSRKVKTKTKRKVKRKARKPRVQREPTFYLCSAMLNDSQPLDRLTKFDTLDDALQCAQVVTQKRVNEGRQLITFYILKAVAQFAPKQTPIDMIITPMGESR